MLTVEEEHRILEAAPPYLRVAIVLLVQTGGRISKSPQARQADTECQRSMAESSGESWCIVFPDLQSAPRILHAVELGRSRCGGAARDAAQQSRDEAPLSTGVVPCMNPRCRRGGYEVDESVYEVVREKSTEKVFTRNCPGDEGSPKGRKRGDHCRNVLHYRLRIKYKPEGLPTP
jgi:hypothetical protein